MKLTRLAFGTVVAATLAAAGGSGGSGGFGGFGGAAFAGITMTAQEVDGNVVFSGTGTLDVSAWTYAGTLDHESVIGANTTAIIGMPSTIDIYDHPVNFTGPANIGPGTMRFIPTSHTGDQFGLNFVSASEDLVVPTAYVSGEQLDGSSTVLNETFASMGLAVGSYTWTWGAPGIGEDFLTINIIPAPGAFALLGIAGLTARRRRRS